MQQTAIQKAQLILTASLAILFSFTTLSCEKPMPQIQQFSHDWTGDWDLVALGDEAGWLVEKGSTVSSLFLAQGGSFTLYQEGELVLTGTYSMTPGQVNWGESLSLAVLDFSDERGILAFQALITPEGKLVLLSKEDHQTLHWIFEKSA
ncbi:MAG: hypothetical protein AAFR61_32380 [Bacteroidota bacterium]